MDSAPDATAPSRYAQESSRLREETLRLIRLSRTERETVDRLSPSPPLPPQYRITQCGTDPDSWVIERMQTPAAPAEPLIMFDSLAGAQRVLDHFARIVQ